MLKGRISACVVAMIALPLASACRPEPAPVPSRWLVLHDDFRTRISLDTTRLPRRDQQPFVVHIRYDLKGQPRVLPDGSAQYSVLESVEVPECAEETARVRSAILLDSLGRQVNYATEATVDSLEPQRMIGVGGPPLCTFLRSRQLLK